MSAPVTLIGIGDDGCLSLTSRAVNAVERASVLAGAERHLAFFPQFRGRKVAFSGGLDRYLDEISEASLEDDVCVLASGDPLFFGLGRRLVERVGAQDLRVLVSPSSVQQAFARLRMPWDDAQLLSVHGRPLKGLVARLQQGDKFALLTDKANNPVVIARHLLDYAEGHWQLHVCERLANPEERVRSFSVEQLAAMPAGELDPLNVMVLLRGEIQRGEELYGEEQRGAGLPWGGLPGHCPDEQYLKRTPQKGLITKAPIRAMAVANLGLRPDSVVWDVGAGSGSVAIEAAKQAWRGQVFAIECNAPCFVQIDANARTHKVDHLTLIQGKAPDALCDLPAPDAVFVGGTRGQMDRILDRILDELNPGGRLVLSAVTIDSVSEAYTAFKARGLSPQILLVNVSQGAPLAHYTRYAAENPIHLFVFEKSL